LKTLLARLVVLIGILFLLAAAGSEADPPLAGPPGQEAPDETDPGDGLAPKRKVSFQLEFAFLIHGVTRTIYFCSLVPQTIPSRQTVDVEYSIAPDNVFSDGMTRYAVWFFQEPADTFQLTIEVNAEIYRSDLTTIRSNGGTGLVDAETLKEFVASEKWIESSAKSIVAAAKDIPDGEDAVSTARNVFDFVRANVKYGGYNAENCGAKRTLSLGTGDCTEYSDLFVALMRAKKIPARVVTGWMSEWSAEGSGKHNWVEFYSGRYGWIPADVLLADQGRASFDRLPNGYLYFTQKRNDKQNPDFCLWRTKSLGDPVTVEAECRVLETEGETLPEPSRW